MTQRDVRGRFIKGHKVVGTMNGAHGKFEPIHEVVQEQTRAQDINTNNDINNIVMIQTIGRTMTRSDKKMFEKDDSSRTGVIRTEMMRGASTVEDIVSAVMSIRTEDDPKRVEKQVKNIIRKVNARKDPWTGFRMAEGNTIQIVPIEDNDDKSTEEESDSTDKDDSDIE